MGTSINSIVRTVLGFHQSSVYLVGFFLALSGVTVRNEKAALRFRSQQA